MSLPPVFSDIRVAQSVVFCVMCCIKKTREKTPYLPPGQLGGLNSVNRHIYPLIKKLCTRTNTLNNSHRSQD